MNDIDKNEVGKRIKIIRLDKGMTQEEFGKYFGASKGNVATWEKGSSLPNAERLKMIAKLGNMKVDNLLHGDFFTYIINRIDSFIPADKKYLKGNIPVHTIGIAWDKIEKNNIKLGEDEKINTILGEVITDADKYFKNTTLKNFEYLKNNINKVRDISDKIIDHDFIKEQFADVASFIEFLNKATMDDIGKFSNIIEAFYNEIEFTYNSDFFLQEVETYLIKYDDFKASNYEYSLNEQSFDGAVYKYSKNNISKFDSALAIYDYLSDIVYVIAQYKAGYNKLEYEKTHFIVYNDEIYTSKLDTNNEFDVYGKSISIEKVSYYSPLLSILY